MKKLSIGLTALTTILAPMSSVAQQSFALEEIVVTAEKRAMNLQKTPIAVTAFSENFIEQSRIESFSDVASRVPGFTFSTPFKTRTLPSLRGASSSIYDPGADQSVAIFVDEVYYGAPGDFDPDLFDLERIEVLRGPQGTLFGRNVVGGAISVITRNPGDELYAKAEASYGNYNALTARATVSGPIADGVSGQISFSSQRRDGLAFNRTTGKDVDTKDKDSIRAKFRITPSDDFEILLSGDYGRDTSSGAARDFIGSAPVGIPEFAGFVPDNDPRVIDQQRDSQMDRETMGVSAVMNWDTDFGRFVSITAYRRNHTILDDEDAIGAPLPTLIGAYDNDLQQFSQELRFVSNNDGPFNWIAGLYYLRMNTDEVAHLDATFYAGTSFGDIQNAVFGTLGLHRNAFIQDVTTNSYAVYAQGTYAVTEALNLTVGGRFTHDRKSGTGALQIEGGGNIFFGADSFSTPFGESWDAFTPKVTADYNFNDDIMAYATVSKGFKSGGFSVLEDAQTTATPYGPEQAWNYEIGFKSRWWEDRLQFNITGFNVEYTNMQVATTLPTGQTVIGNAGKARVRGVEVELSVTPAEGLLLWGNYSYLDGKYKDFGGFSGTDTAMTPPHSLSVGGSYTANLSESMYLTFQGDYQYKATHVLEPRDPAEAGPFQSGFDNIINGSITLGLAEGQWELVLWGKNLTNETYTVYGQDLRGIIYGDAQLATDPLAAGANFPRYNEPRTYGLSVRWKLN